MTASLHRLFRPRDGWTNEERAKFLGIERLLADVGLAVDVEHGVSDEGDPWCVFCARATGDVVIHAACIDGRFMIDSPMLPRPIEGRSFDRCAERFFEDCRLPIAPGERRSGVMLHPSAMLASLFLTILLYAQAMSEQDLFGIEALDADGAGPGAAEGGLVLRLKALAQQVADYVSGDGTQQPQQQQGGSGAAMAAIPAGMALAAIAIAEDLARAQAFDLSGAGEEGEAARVAALSESERAASATPDPRRLGPDGAPETQSLAIEAAAPAEKSAEAEADDPAAMLLARIIAHALEGSVRESGTSQTLTAIDAVGTQEQAPPADEFGALADAAQGTPASGDGPKDEARGPAGEMFALDFGGQTVNVRLIGFDDGDLADASAFLDFVATVLIAFADPSGRESLDDVARLTEVDIGERETSGRADPEGPDLSTQGRTDLPRDGLAVDETPAISTPPAIPAPPVGGLDLDPAPVFADFLRGLTGAGDGAAGFDGFLALRASFESGAELDMFISDATGPLPGGGGSDSVYVFFGDLARGGELNPHIEFENVDIVAVDLDGSDTTIVFVAAEWDMPFA